MRGTEKLYGVLVNRVPGIRERYQKKRNRVTGIRRGGVWLYLIGLNVFYYILHNKKLKTPEKYPYYEKKSLPGPVSESMLSPKANPSELAEKLSVYDVISFDVFDTLILRPFFRAGGSVFSSGRKAVLSRFQENSSGDGAESQGRKI